MLISRHLSLLRRRGKLSTNLPAMRMCFYLFLQSCLTFQNWQKPVDCPHPETWGGFNYKPSVSCQIMQRSSCRSIKEHRKLCTWLNIQQGWTPLPCLIVGLPMPPTLHHHRRWATTMDTANALCEGGNPVWDNDLPRCQRNPQHFENQSQGGSPGASPFFLSNWCNLNWCPYFQKYPGWIHVGFDGWTSPNVFSFLSVVVHTAVEGKLHSFVLDFILWVLLRILSTYSSYIIM